jgi:DNA helicase IV
MIKKLEEKIDYLVTNGEKVEKVMRQPNNNEIIEKINEIIEYINKKESIHYLF